MSSKSLMLVLFMFTFVVGSFAQTYTYIGAAKCKMCHNKTTTGKQYDKWAAGPHAKAMASLNATEAKDPKCLKCHQTTSKFPTEGVTCEGCHGPGSAYKSPAVMKDHAASVKKGLIEQSEAICKKCHNKESPTFKGFDYAKYSAKIAHPNPAK